MKSALVTGAAGFIGSNLAERLVSNGFRVVGVDSFTDYYPKAVKLSNLSVLRQKNGFEFIRGDLNSTNLNRITNQVEFVFHLAAQPGVRPSWGGSFDRYVDDNIRATQRLLEACKDSKVKRFVYASSSSIYGNAEAYPTSEDAIPSPLSPYGATKLAAESLCQVYRANFRVPVVILRYFTVYGPRQRPDMAFHRFISRIIRGEQIEIYGDGDQERDFTFVDDVVSATMLAVRATPGGVYNVGSGRTVPLTEAISRIEAECDRKAKIAFRKNAAGDVTKTSADISRIKAELGYEPKSSLKDGLKAQVTWQLHPESEHLMLNIPEK